MEQRIYRGNIDPNALADYLVGMFNGQPAMYNAYPHSMAQKINQGERVFVQITRSGDWIGHEHGALGVQILRVAGGVSVSVGQSDWLDLDQTGLAGMLLGALFFPPLLLFPLISGLTRSTFVQDVWGAIDHYCMQTRPRAQHAPQGFYCSYCGAFNHPAAACCHSCKAPFDSAPQPRAAQSSQEQAPGEPPGQKQPFASEPVSPALSESVVCPRCGATVAAARFCGNCAAPLRQAAPD